MVSYISAPQYSSSNGKYLVFISPMVGPEEQNYFYIQATNLLDNSTAVTPGISFNKAEPIERESIVSATGEEEGAMEPSPLINKEVFEKYGLSGECKFASNL